MTKTKHAQFNIEKMGYKIEYCISKRGNSIAVAIKEGQPNLYATTLIKLEKLINSKLATQVN